MNNPDKILLGLSCHVRSDCGGCPYEDQPDCSSQLAADAEMLYKQLERERDAAVKRLARYRKCIDCKSYSDVVEHNSMCDGCEYGSDWKWRGVEVE